MKQRNIWASMQGINEILLATSTFVGSSNMAALAGVVSVNTIWHRVSDKSTMAAITGSTNKITQYLSLSAS